MSSKTVLRAYKYRIYPSKGQQVLLSKTFGCVRFVWNQFVDAFNNKAKPLSTTQYRNDPERPWLKEVSASAIQQKEMDFKEYNYAKNAEHHQT